MNMLFGDSLSNLYCRAEAIGSGTSSVVYRVHRRTDGHEFACKVSRNGDDDDGTALQQTIREAETLKLLGDHESLIALHEDGLLLISDSAPGDSQLPRPRQSFLVMDLMEGSDLGFVLRERGSLTEDDTRAIMKQLLDGIVHMHDLGVTHRDIKLENILNPSALDHTIIRLSDFGLAASGCDTSSQSCLTRCCGTPLYIAPEMIKPNVLYGNRVDEWSSGVVMFMLLSGYPPFFGEDIVELFTNISKKGMNFNDPVWELISPEARDLVVKLLTKDPERRLSAREALRHPWLHM